MSPYIFHVTIYNEFEKKEEMESGILFAQSYSAAASIVDDTYRNTLIDMRLYALEEGNLLVLPEELVERIIKESVW